MIDRLTDFLDFVGALLLVAALAVLAASLEPTEIFRGLAAAGAGLLICSWIFDGAPLPKRKGRS